MTNWPGEAIALAVTLVAVILVLVAMLIYMRKNRDRDALAKTEQWRQQHIEQVRSDEAAKANLVAVAQMDAWKQEFRAKISREAVRQSQAVIRGKLTEHLIPFFPGFPYNPKDARFLGSPIDLIVFDGLDDEYVEKIVFLEVKVGSGRESRRQMQIRDAIHEKRVEWQTMTVPAGELAEWSDPEAASEPS